MGETMLFVLTHIALYVTVRWFIANDKLAPGVHSVGLLAFREGPPPPKSARIEPAPRPRARR